MIQFDKKARLLLIIREISLDDFSDKTPVASSVSYKVCKIDIACTNHVWEGFKNSLILKKLERIYLKKRKIINLQNLFLLLCFEENDDIYYYQPGYDLYIEARNALIEATDAASVSAAMSAFDAALYALVSSIEAYALYAQKFQEAYDFIVNNESLFGDAIDNLSDYLMVSDEPTELYPNGTGAYILEYGLLTTEQVLAEIAFLEQLLSDAIANSMVDGTDCTNLLKNASFAEAGGWTSQPGVTFPTNDRLY